MSAAATGTATLAIRGAQVIDGSGAPRFAADVLVAGDTIQAIVPPGEGSAREALDGRGLVLCPGFIDSHTHDDALVLHPAAENPKLAQGVCTVVTGNCGLSLAPLVHADPPPPLDILGQGDFRFPSFAQYLRALDAARPALNVVPLVGHTSLRVKHVRDLGRAATPAEVDAMAAEVREALDSGAFGLSTGVYYPPARAASTQELLGVCAPLRAGRSLLTMHLRDEGDRIDEALREALAVGAACDARLVLSHHKVVGARNHGHSRHTLETIAQAAAHQPVCMDCYPYDASSTMLEADKAVRTGHVLVSWSRPHPEAAGRTLQSLADEWGLDLHAAALRLMPGGAIYFGMHQDDVDRVLAHPLSMVCSDGLPHDRLPHPRLWGTFPRVLGHYSRERGLFPLETAVHKMTGLPARRFGLRGRGLVAPGMAADLVLFDPLRVRDAATYAQPTAPPVGIHCVIVNGRIAMWQGAAVDVHAGRRLLPEGADAAEARA